MPQLAIVTQAQWDAVRARKDRNPSRSNFRSRKFLISGLVKCSACNSSYTSMGGGRFACSQNKDRGTCDNKKRVKVAEVEARILASLKRHLLDPKYIQTFLDECRKEWDRLTSGQGAELKHLIDQRDRIRKKIDRLVAMIEAGTMSQAVADQLAQRERELRDIETRIADQPDPDILPLPANLTKVWADILSDIDAALAKGSTEVANALMHKIIDKVTLTPTPDGYALQIGDVGGRGRGT